MQHGIHKSYGFKKGAAAIAILLAFSMVAVGCTKKSSKKATGTSADKPVDGGTLVDYYTFSTGEPAHIDPGLTTEVQGAQVSLLVYDGLTAVDYKTGKTIPWLADKWDVSTDGMTYTFHVHKGTTYSNGDPVLPSDFVYAWNRVAQKSFASDLSYHLSVIEGADDVIAGKATSISGLSADDTAGTVTVKLTLPYSIFPSTLSHNVFSPLDAKAMASVTDQSAYEQGVMLGNGPYMMAKPWDHNQQVTLTKNPKYWGGPDGKTTPHIQEIDFKISSDIDSAYSAFQANQGLTAAVPTGSYAAAAQKYPTTSDLNPSLGIYYVGFNQDDKTVGGADNLELRQAIALVIDKAQINTDAFSDSRKIATGITPPGIPGQQDNIDNIAGAAKPDVAHAKQLLADWETKTGKKATSLTIKLNFNEGASHEKVMNDIASDLKNNLGIKSTLTPGNSDTYFEDMRNGKGQFLRAGWIADYVAYDNMMCPILCSGKDDNLTHYANPAFDDLVTQARKATDETAAEALYRQAETLALKDVPLVPIVWYTNNVVWSDQLKNVEVSPLQFVNYENMWLANGANTTVSTAAATSSTSTSTTAG